MNITQQQIRAIISLSKKERYLNFISTVVDWENIWSFVHEKTLYLFPAKEYAKLFTEAKKYDIKKVFSYTLEDFSKNLLEHNIRHIAIFPTDTDDAYFIDKKKLLQDIEEEFSKY